MARRTATTANAILGLLALRKEWSTWELATQLRRNMRFFWPRAESQIYEEAKSLVARGSAKDRRSYTGRRPRTSYSITAKGRRELAQWLATPPKPAALECEPLLRVFLGSLGEADQALAAVRQLHADGDAVLEVGAVVGPEYVEGRAPFQDQLQWRALVFDFLSSYALMLTDWADRAEATLSAWHQQTADQRQTAAIERIRAVLDQYPTRAGPR